MIKVLGAIAVDLQAGELPPLESYLRRFPDDADTVRAEYERVTSEDVEPHRIAGRYEVVATLGEGAYAKVLLANDTVIRREVAIKLLKRDESDDARMRLIREAEAANRIDGQGVAAVHEVGSDEGRPFLVLPRIRGSTLERVFTDAATSGAAPAAPAVVAGKDARQQWLLRCVLHVARALAAAHRSDVVHRDVKPSNIVLSEEGHPVLVDFGLAWIGDSEPSETDRATIASALCGTPAYAAPETLTKGAGTIRPSPALDVWSLGVVLFQGLMLRCPFVRRPGRSLDQSIKEDPVPRLDPVFGRDLRAVVEKALAKSPAQRYPDAEALACDLEKLLAGGPVSARPVGFLRRILFFAKSRPRATVGMLALLMVAVTTIVTFVVWRERSLHLLFLEAEATRMAEQYAGETRWLEASAQNGVSIRARLQQLDAGAARVEAWMESVGASRPLRLAFARIHSAVGGLRLATNEARKGVEQVERAVQLWQQLRAEGGSCTDEVEQGLALSLIRRGESHVQAQRFEQARELFRQALVIDRSRLVLDPQNPDRLSAVAFGFLRVGAAARSLRIEDFGLGDLHESARLLESAASLEPRNPARRMHVGAAWLEIAAALRDRGASEESRRAAADRLKEIYQQATADFPLAARLWVKLSVAEAQVLELETNLDRRRAGADRMLRAAERGFSVDPQDPATAHAVATAHRAVARERSQRGGLQNAVESARSAIAFAERAVDLGPAILFYRQEVDDCVMLTAQLMRANEMSSEAEALLWRRRREVERDLGFQPTDPARVLRACAFLTDERQGRLRDVAGARRILQEARRAGVRWKAPFQRLERQIEESAK